MREAGMRGARRAPALGVIIAATFAFDLYVPLGVAAGIPYVLAVLAALWLPHRRAVIATAIGCTLLTLAVAFIKWQIDGGLSWIAALNRVFAIGALWAVALLVHWRERTLARLLTSQAMHEAIVDSSVNPIIVIDERGIVESFNPAAERLFGYQSREIIGWNVSLLMPQPYRAEHDEYLARYLRTGEAKIIGIGREVVALRKDRTLVPVDLAISEVKLEGRRVFTGILRDLTETHRMQREMQEQASLARLGEMAAVVAHEVKNPLAGIGGALQVIRNRLPNDSEERQVVGDILERIGALDATMRDLLQYARPRPPKLAPVSLPGLLRSSAQPLADDEKLRGIEVRIECPHIDIMADADMLRGVFLNLFLNAAQAMDGQGHVDVTGTVNREFCTITVADTGPGIPAAIRDKIFEPFFTTKSRGTGLGLAIAKRIIDKHRGGITIACPPGGGTTVTMTLPTGGSISHRE